MSDPELFQAARRIRRKAHVPYSGFAVGTAIRNEAGSVHVGCNVENAALPEGWCSETSPEARRIVSVHVVAELIDGRLTTPCGGCRQRLAEFGSPDTVVNVSSPGGERSATYRLGDLLPQGFAMGGSQ